MPDDMRDMYGGGEEQEPPPAEEAGKEREGEQGSMFLMPKAVHPEMKEGDSFRARVVKVMDDQYECEHEPEEGPDSEHEATEEPAKRSAMADMMD